MNHFNGKPPEKLPWGSYRCSWCKTVKQCGNPGAEPNCCPECRGRAETPWPITVVGVWALVSIAVMVAYGLASFFSPEAERGAMWSALSWALALLVALAWDKLKPEQRNAVPQWAGMKSTSMILESLNNQRSTEDDRC